MALVSRRRPIDGGIRDPHLGRERTIVEIHLEVEDGPRLQEGSATRETAGEAQVDHGNGVGKATFHAPGTFDGQARGASP